MNGMEIFLLTVTELLIGTLSRDDDAANENGP